MSVSRNSALRLIRKDRKGGEPPIILAARVARVEGRLLVTGDRHDVSESFYAVLLGFINDMTERGLMKLTEDGREEIRQLCEAQAGRSDSN